MLFLHNILNSVWMIEPAYAANFLPLVDAYIRGENMIQQPAEKKVFGIEVAQSVDSVYTLSEYGAEISPEKAPKNSLAIVHITDSITKYDQDCGPAGMLTKAKLLQRCYNNPNINAIALVIDSGGGEGYAMRHMVETIGKRNKPVGAFISDNAFSAAAGIATAADIVIASSTWARIGSFGTYVTIADYKKRYEQMGIELLQLYATDSNDKNQAYIQALKGNTELLQKVVNTFNDQFLSMVEQNRGEKLKADRSVWGTGKEWFAEEALELGIIDGIDTFENFINYFNV